MAVILPIHRNRHLHFIRFERAVTPNNVNATSGSPRIDCPTLDERGFSGTICGPVFPMGRNREHHLRIVRQNLSNDAELFIVIEDESKVELVDPVDGSLPSQERVHVKLKGLARGTSRITVHYGSSSGVIIGELTAQVYSTITVRCVAHRVRITGFGTGATTTAHSTADINSLFRRARRIWRPLGINLSWSVLSTTTSVALATAGRVSWNSDTSTGYSTPDGTMRSANWWNEPHIVLGANWANGRVNVYFVRRIDDISGAGWGAMAWDKDLKATNNGVIIQDSGDYNDLAHELGHMFDLDHVNEGGRLTNRRRDIWSRGRLMFTHNPHTAIAARSYQRNLGFGNRVRGAMITTKNFPNSQEPSDDETRRARLRAVSPV